MTAAWQTGLATRSEGALQALAVRLSPPEVQRRLRLAVAALLLLWLIYSLVKAIWSLVPAGAPLAEIADPINPALPVTTAVARRTVDIDALRRAELFGAADDEALALARAEDARSGSEAAEPAATELSGIEDDAPDTRLPLVLKGVVSAADESLGQAVIEHGNDQRRYRVGDELPVSGRVLLAKVLPMLVVLDNDGRYEVLRLFEEGSMALVAQPRPATRVRRPADPPRAAVATDGDAGRIAASYRERLYTDPQSLAELVSVSDVRRDGQLVGYRLQPGPAVEAFNALGFRAGDLVTAVNGKALSDPANAVRLYQEARDVDAVVFDLRRGEEELTITVNLDAEQ